MKRVIYIFLAAICALSTLGLGYAKWGESLAINGTVETGELDWEFLDNSFSQKDNGPDWTGDLQASPILSPLDKDVGCTTGSFSDRDGDGDYDLMTVTIDNAYPCYANDIQFWVHCNGSVPLIIERVVVNGEVEIASTPSSVVLLDLNNDGMNDLELLWGDNLGAQLHYCDSVQISFMLHVLQPAPENSSLKFDITMVAVQWNEYNGSPLPTPTVTSVNHSEGVQGETVDVTVQGTNFEGTTAITFGHGVVVNSFTIDNSTQISASVSIDNDATPGARDVTVTTLAGTGTLSNAFTVLHAVPVITGVDPNAGMQGQTLEVVVFGDYFVDLEAVGFGAGVVTDSFAVVGQSQINATISVDATASPGTRDVSVINLAGTASLADAFTVSAMPSGPPPAPTLVSPTNGAVVTGTAVTYEWNAVLGAVNYRLVVSKSNDILNQTAKKTIVDVGNMTAYVDTGYPANGTKYYWWVFAYAADGSISSWSQVSVNGRWLINTSIGAPALLSPPNGAVISGNSVTFEWNPVNGAVNYRLVVSRSSDFLNQTAKKTIVDVGNTTAYVDTGYPANGTKYYWWVFAYSADGSMSPWSQVSANGRWFTNA